MCACMYIYEHILRQIYKVYSCRLTTVNIVQETPWIKFLFKCFTIVNIIYTRGLQLRRKRTNRCYIDRTTFYYYYYYLFILHAVYRSMRVSHNRISCCGRGGQILLLLLLCSLRSEDEFLDLKNKQNW